MPTQPGIELAFMKANFICVLSLYWTLAASAQNPSPDQHGCTPDSEFVVRDVNFEESISLSRQDQATVKLRLFGRCFDGSNVSDSGAIVLSAFQNAGYFRAFVSDPVLRVLDATRSPKPVALIFDVVEGHQYKVRTIVWSGIRAFTPEQIEEISPLKVEDIFNKSKVDEFVEGAKNLYRASGYVNASVTSEIKVRNPYGLEVHFFINEGPLFPSLSR